MNNGKSENFEIIVHRHCDLHNLSTLGMTITRQDLQKIVFLHIGIEKTFSNQSTLV